MELRDLLLDPREPLLEALGGGVCARGAASCAGASPAGPRLSGSGTAFRLGSVLAAQQCA